jgi:hypothetical protein
MSLLGSITGLGPILDIGKSILDRVIPDPAAKAEAQLKLLELAQKGELAELAAETDLMKGQLDVNKAEASNANLFVAGWRPFVGWVCGANLAWTWILAPLFNWIASLLGAHVTAPSLPANESYPIILGMLGIGAMRTIEKAQGVATSVGGVVLTPVHKATPQTGQTAAQDPQATPPAPEVPVQPTLAEPAPKRRWIG